MSARFFPGFFIFLFTAITFSLGNAEGLYATGRSGSASEKTTQQPYVAARDANRLVLIVERRDQPHQPGWNGPDPGLPCGHFLLHIVASRAARGVSAAAAPVHARIPSGFLARGPPLAVA